MFVIENEHDDPFEGSWTEKGQIKTQFESFSLMARYFRIAKDFIMFGHNKIRESQGTQIFICQK